MSITRILSKDLRSFQRFPVQTFRGATDLRMIGWFSSVSDLAHPEISTMAIEMTFTVLLNLAGNTSSLLIAVNGYDWINLTQKKKITCNDSYIFQLVSENSFTLPIN